MPLMNVSQRVSGSSMYRPKELKVDQSQYDSEKSSKHRVGSIDRNRVLPPTLFQGRIFLQVMRLDLSNRGCPAVEEFTQYVGNMGFAYGQKGTYYTTWFSG